MRIWLIEDRIEIREGVASLIQQRVAGAEITGQFAQGGDALKALAAGKPFDVALVDLGLPDIGGTEVIRQLRAARRDAAIIALTVRFDDEAVFSALGAGASGYLTKDASDQDIVDAVRSATSGAAPFSPDIGHRVAASFWPSRGEQAPSQAPPAAVLTPREREVLDLLCTGASYKDIGTALGITLGTVQTHVKNVYGKLGVATKVEAVRWTMGSSLPPFSR